MSGPGRIARHRCQFAQEVAPGLLARDALGRFLCLGDTRGRIGIAAGQCAGPGKPLERERKVEIADVVLPTDFERPPGAVQRRFGPDALSGNRLVYHQNAR